MRRLCIVGGGVTKDRAPFNDDDATIWSTASVGLGLPRCDVIFELHDNVFTDEQLAPFVCYVRDNKTFLPKSRRFPIDRLEAIYGKHFNGTVVMMLAFAHYEGYKNIELYGIDFSSDEEYARRNQFYWMMGYLSAKGVKITICPGGFMNDTCTTYMYEDNGMSYITEMKTRANSQFAEDESNIRALIERKAYMRGILDTLDKIERRS